MERNLKSFILEPHDAGKKKKKKRIDIQINAFFVLFLSRICITNWTLSFCETKGMKVFSTRVRILQFSMSSEKEEGLLSVTLNSVLGTVTFTSLLHRRYIAHLQQQCHKSKCLIFQKRLLKALKCCNFLWVQRRHNCSQAASFANCVMTLYLLKVHLQTFLSIPVTHKMPNTELWHSCRKWATCCNMLSATFCSSSDRGAWSWASSLECKQENGFNLRTKRRDIIIYRGWEFLKVLITNILTTWSYSVRQESYVYLSTFNKDATDQLATREIPWLVRSEIL